jgi:hypothetical protein
MISALPTKELAGPQRGYGGIRAVPADAAHFANQFFTGTSA